jgi:hypothetical protein
MLNQVTRSRPSGSTAVPASEMKDDDAVVAGAAVGDVIVMVGSEPTVLVNCRFSVSKYHKAKSPAAYTT